MRSSFWRHGTCSDAFKSMPVKSDRNDARKIAQLMRLGWFRPVHCKSITAQEIRAMLTARKLVQSKLLDARKQPARDFARLRAEGRQDDAEIKDWTACRCTLRAGNASSLRSYYWP